MTSRLPHRAGVRGSAVSYRGDPRLQLEARSVAGALGNTTSWFSFVPVWAMLGSFWPYWVSSFAYFFAYVAFAEFWPYWA